MHWLDPLFIFIAEIPVNAWMIEVILVLALVAALWRIRRTRKKTRSPAAKPYTPEEAGTQPERAETQPPPGETEAVRSDTPVRPRVPASPAAPAAAETPKPGTQPASPAAKKPTRLSLTERLRKGLSKTRAILSTDLEKLLAGDRTIDDALFEELEELLITADIGVPTTMKIVERLMKQAALIPHSDALKEKLRQEILTLLPENPPVSAEFGHKPQVIMVVGVNGVGKTTTIGKIAAHHTAAGRKVIVGAADTFRAAAVEQLSIWADRANADIVKHREGADPAAVAYDSVEAAVARNADVVLIDTAGRLHTKVNLMEELKKIQRAISKKLPGAPHEILLVIDATTGQNALKQAEIFHDALGLTGIALTKLDGTARGGIVIGICSTMDIPLRYVGVGEGVEDLQPFDPKSFIAALF